MLDLVLYESKEKSNIKRVTYDPGERGKDHMIKVFERMGPSALVEKLAFEMRWDIRVVTGRR